MNETQMNTLPALPHIHLLGRIVRLRKGSELWSHSAKHQIGTVVGVHFVDRARTHLLVKRFGSHQIHYQFRFEIEQVSP